MEVYIKEKRYYGCEIECFLGNPLHYLPNYPIDSTIMSMKLKPGWRGMRAKIVVRFEVTECNGGLVVWDTQPLYYQPATGHCDLSVIFIGNCRKF